MFGRSKRIADRQVVIVLVIALIVGTATGFGQVVVDYLEQRNRIDAALQNAVDAFSDSAANALWELNDQLGQSLVSGLTGFDFITDAVLITSSDYPLAAASEPVRPGGQDEVATALFGPARLHRVPLTYSDGTATHSVGTLALTVDPGAVCNRFLNRAFAALIGGIIKSVALGILLLLAFYITLTRPLTTLTTRMAEIDPVAPDGDARIEVAPEHAEDELGQIAAIANQQLQQIRRHLAGLHEAERELRATNAELESRVAARTADLSAEVEARITAENELRVALREAHRNADTRSQFLANMSHELRTPLNAIIGFADLTREHPDGMPRERIREYLGYIHESGVHLLQLVNNILDLSRIDSGRMPVNLEGVDLGRFITATIEPLRPVIDKNGNRVVKRFDPMIGTVITDPVRLRQVLNNLIGNASKFTQKGTITISTAVDEEDPAVLHIAVRDTGIGIEENALERIFEGYSQAMSTSANGIEGSGLGLMIVRGTCELMGWQIDVQSELNKGTTFTLTLPETPSAWAGQVHREMPDLG